MGSLGRFAKNWGSRHSCEDKMIAHPVVMALLHEWLLPNYLLTAAQAWGMARFFPTIFKTCLEGFGPSPWFPAQHSSTSVCSPIHGAACRWLIFNQALWKFGQHHPAGLLLFWAWEKTYLYWFVVWNISYFSIYWELHNPNWLICFRGVKKSTSIQLSISFSIELWNQLLFWWFRDVCLIFASPFWQLCSSANN